MIRVATPSDQTLLEQFTCRRTGEWFELAVESYIRDDLLRDVAAGVADFRALLFVARSGEVAAIAAHYRKAMRHGVGTYIVAIAVATAFQSTKNVAGTGDRLSVFALRAAITDSLRRGRGPEIEAWVAVGHSLGAKTCEAVGMQQASVYVEAPVPLRGGGYERYWLYTGMAAPG